MTEIFALFNPKNDLMEIGKTLERVTKHLDPAFTTEIHNSLFGEDDLIVRKKILESAGYKVKTGVFKEKNNKPMNTDKPVIR